MVQIRADYRKQNVSISFDKNVSTTYVPLAFSKKKRITFAKTIRHHTVPYQQFFEIHKRVIIPTLPDVIELVLTCYTNSIRLN